MPKDPVEPIPGWGGFVDPNYTPVPDDFFDVLLAHLTDAELRVLLYIIRRTYGFKKSSDQISMTQITEGIVTHDGRRLDYGAGLSRAGAQQAMRRLVARGIVQVEAQQSATRGHEANRYSLRKAGSPMPTTWARVAYQVGMGSLPPEQGPAHQVAPQETGQETVQQEDRGPTFSTGEPLRYSAYIAAVVLDHARELGAEPRGPSGVETALRHWAASGQDEAAFVARLHAARDQVRRQQKPGTDKWRLYLDALRKEVD